MSEENKLERFDREVKLLAPWIDEEKFPHYKRLKEFFGDHLYKMSELSVSPLSNSLGIMFKGKDETYISNLCTFMSEAGIEEEKIGNFKKLNTYFPGTDVLFKADFSDKNSIKVSFYHQSLISPRITASIMRGMNVQPASIEYFLDVISFLMRKKSLYIGFNYKSGTDTVLKTFFCNSIEKSGYSLCPGIASIMAKLNISSRLISLFVDFHNYLASEPQRSVFTSVVFTDKIESLVKIDYEGIYVDKVMEIYRALKIPSEEIEKLPLLCKELNTDKITYLGIKYLNDRPPVFKCYFTRRYALEDDPTQLAEILEETRWVNQ
jgi:hypothetical protein